MSREPHSLGCQAIQIRRAEFLLAIASQIAVTEIIRDDENDIWQLFLCLCLLTERGAECKSYETRIDQASHGVARVFGKSAPSQGSTQRHSDHTASVKHMRIHAAN